MAKAFRVHNRIHVAGTRTDFLRIEVECPSERQRFDSYCNSLASAKKIFLKLLRQVPFGATKVRGIISVEVRKSNRKKRWQKLGTWSKGQNLNTFFDAVRKKFDQIPPEASS